MEESLYPVGTGPGCPKTAEIRFSVASEEPRPGILGTGRISFLVATSRTRPPACHCRAGR